MNRLEAIDAVARERRLEAERYGASQAPSGSMHDGLWYVSERHVEDLNIDDCVWIVFSDGLVTRGIPVGNPIHPSTPLEALRRQP